MGQFWTVLNSWRTRTDFSFDRFTWHRIIPKSVLTVCLCSQLSRRTTSYLMRGVFYAKNVSKELWLHNLSLEERQMLMQVQTRITGENVCNFNLHKLHECYHNFVKTPGQFTLQSCLLNTDTRGTRKSDCCLYYGGFRVTEVARAAMNFGLFRTK